MRTEFEDVLRSTTAVQVAVYELLDEEVSDQQAIIGLEMARVRLNVSIKRLKQYVKEA